MKRILLALLATIVLFAGCAPKPLPPPPPQFYEHTVQYQGETLALISSWYTNTSNNWKEIAAANPELKPNKLKIGTVVLIPNELVRQRIPLPAKIVKIKAAEPKKAAPTPTPALEDVSTTAPQAPAEAAAPIAPVAAEAAAPAAEPTPAAITEAPKAEAPTATEASVVVSTPSAASSEKVKEDLLDEILNQKKEGAQ